MKPGITRFTCHLARQAQISLTPYGMTHLPNRQNPSGHQPLPQISHGAGGAQSLIDGSPPQTVQTCEQVQVQRPHCTPEL